MAINNCVYRQIEFEPTGRKHIVIGEHQEIPADFFHQDHSPDLFDEFWTVSSNSRSLPSREEGVRNLSFRSREHLLIALRHRLAREHMGLRLYVSGTQHFAWAVYGLGESLGLGSGEMRLHIHGDGARRVRCGHCRTFVDGVTTNIVECPGCHAQLFVRDHFSRQLNAYAGVQIDAEQPGVLPAIEERLS